MKILVYAAYAINTPHFETELEILQRRLDKDDDVYVIGCNANLLCCDVNWEHEPFVCLKCIGRRNEGLKLLSKPVTILPHYLLTLNDKAELQAFECSLDDLEDLKKVMLDNFDVGYGVMSSLVSMTRDPHADVRGYRQSIQRLFLSSIAVYRSIQNYLDMYAFDRVYVYNGRYAPVRAVIRACQGKKVDCYTHEKGSSLTCYGLWQNTTIHDLENTACLIVEEWEMAADNRDREDLAKQFYLDRVQGISRTWIAFTKNQQKDLLPADWDERKKNIAIFVSSEDEFVAIGDQWKHPLYSSQHEGIIALLESTGGHQDIHFYLRVHPNLQGVDNRQTRDLLSINSANVTIIPADSRVSTYALLRNSAQVVSFGSTVGIEAVFWGVPSILLGQCFYRFLGATYNPESHEEAVEMILSNLKPKGKLPALMYGYYFHTFGREFLYYDSKGIYEGYFRGAKVQPVKLIQLLSRILSWGTVTSLSKLLKNISYLQNSKIMGISYGKF